MKNNLLIAMTEICIITFIIGLIGCSNVKHKSEISENHSNTISNTNETDILNSSDASLAVVPTQPSNSPSDNIIKGEDYSKYLKKVWILKSWDISKSYNNKFSFCIYKIAKGKIEGKFMINGIVEPDDEFYTSNYLGDINGIINSNIADCQFSDKNGNDGNIKITLLKNNEIEANIKFISKSKFNQDKSLDGIFLFKPYNLKNLVGFSSFKDQSFIVDLNSWGIVKFVSGKMLGGNHTPTVAFLTGSDGNIYYDFNYLPNNVEFNSVSFQDVTYDGLKDIIIIYGVGEYVPEDCYVKIFSQNENGLFAICDLTGEINDSVKSKDIKSIKDYLSKRAK